MVLLGGICGCAPIKVQSYSVEYVYRNRRVMQAADPSWDEKIVYTFDNENQSRVISALVYEDGNETMAVAFLYYTYWDLENLSHQAVNNRLRTVERYSDSDIFKTEGSARVKDSEKTASKLISYDVYETDPKDGKCLSVKTYYYNVDDPVIENRNVPMKSTEFKYFSGTTDQFLPEQEIISLFLADTWVYQSVVQIEYDKIDGKKLPVARRSYINPVSDESWYCIEIYTYDENGNPIRKETYTAEEYQKEASVRIPETTVLYVTEELS